jgi:hypothetical protein
MATRREFTQGSMLALFMAFLAASKPDQTHAIETSNGEPFDFWKHESTYTGMVVNAGIRKESEDAADAIGELMIFGEELPEEHEWARDRCRETLYRVLDRLEGRI